jgi:NAD(P)H dehydrogenase (quinone)
VITPSHRDTEEALRESGLAWTALRNAFYAEYQVPAGAQAIATGQLIHNSGEGRNRLRLARGLRCGGRPRS